MPQKLQFSGAPLLGRLLALSTNIRLLDWAVKHSSLIQTFANCSHKKFLTFSDLLSLFPKLSGALKLKWLKILDQLEGKMF
jgi:hypothetical protein